MLETTHHGFQTRVCVRDLPVLADVGINPDEIGRRQPLVVTVELALAAGPIHSVDQTIDYRRIAAVAEELSEIHTPLIESFAQKLATRCAAMSKVVSVMVKIDKPFALPKGMASVSVSMHNTTIPGGTTD